MFNKTKYLLTGFFLVTFFSLNTFASNDTTSALRGDAGVSGATVVVTNVSTGITKTTTADANGVFSVGNLKPGGPYKITISKSGYATESLDDVFLTVSETARLNVALVSNADIDEVVVTGTKTATVQTSLAVTAQDIENIPSIERSISDYVKRFKNIC
jgi:nucleoid-associated protein YgaU